MTGVDAAILGFIQGATEFLPISSTGHLVLAQQLLGLETDTFTFDIFLHFATLVAVFLFFWKDLLKLRPRDFVPILIASIPAGVIGVLFNDAIEQLSASLHTTGWEMLVTAGLNFGCAYLLTKTSKTATENTDTPSLRDIPAKQAGIVGLFQAFAMLPAVSRSGATVFGGLWTGLDRKTAFKFSFIISIPAILGANLLEILKVVKDNGQFPEAGLMLIGALVSLVVGLASLYLLKYMINHAQFHWFGWYCLILGVGIIGFQFLG
jgi:undecaprenyl-diphosphatase